MSLFVEVTDNTYTSDQLMNMESKIVSALDFNLNNITSLKFLEAVES